jgi:hypothetical protein
MCRNIKPLFNYEPTVSDAEIRASALQYVRKVSGFTRPSKANEQAFEEAVKRVEETTRSLLGRLTTNAPARDRAHEIARARERRARDLAREVPAD